MKLLLQKNIENLGKIGDIVEVPPGYARNYLLPQGMGVELTRDNLNRFESMKRRLIAQEEENKAKHQVLAKELEKASVTIIAQSTEEGHLYGSVTARDISAQLLIDGLSVDPKCILLEAPLKELGIYKVKVRLHPEVECTTKIWVVKGDETKTSLRRLELDEGSLEEEKKLLEESSQEEDEDEDDEEFEDKEEEEQED